MTDRIKVHIIESERGWGQRIDDVRYFDTYEQALAFCREFNKENDKEYAPDWYMYATIVNLPTR